MKRSLNLLFLSSMILSLGSSEFSQSVRANLDRGDPIFNVAHKRALTKWLAKHGNLRLATETDCDCSDDINQMRRGYGGDWKAVPNYQPYYLVGDFNSDGVADFAIALIDKSKSTKQFDIAIFNGPFANGRPKTAALFKEGLDLKGMAFHFGPPRPGPYRLILGRFESDNSILFIPHGKRYIIK